MSNDSITNREKTPPHSQTYANSVSPNPTIGIVIPIYNVEKYLKECLDSVLNQDYPHYEVLLINDGSTDSSLEIAKEYTRKDKRFILFDKENGGLSSARNVGIEYFSGKYTLEHKESIDKHNTDTVIESSLIPFSIISNTKYKIHAVYKSSLCIESIDATHEEYNKDSKDNIAYSLNSFNISIFSKDTIANDLKYNIHTLDRPKIDYIIFLDSDDYWKTDCLSSCVACLYDSNNAIDTSIDIVWFEWEYYYDGVENGGWETLQDMYLVKDKETKKGKITSDEWLLQCKRARIEYFAFTWSSMIRFDFLKKSGLLFLDSIQQEDVHFQTLLYFYSRYIYVLPKVLHAYRIRPNSITSYKHNNKAKKANKKSPAYLEKIHKAFNGNARYIKEYHRVSSWFIMLMEVEKSLDDAYKQTAKEELDMPIAQKVDIAREVFYPLFVKTSSHLSNFPEDPLNLIPRLPELQSYAITYHVKLKRIRKISIFHNKYYRLLTPLILIYRVIKECERNIREYIKGK